MSFYCTKCGSPNHLAFDCSKPQDPSVRPPEPPKSALDLHRETQAAEAGVPAARGSAPGDPAPLLPPTWPGGPRICAATMLPALADEKAVGEFLATNFPNDKVKRRWECGGHWHVSVEVQTFGSTSGTQRQNTLPKNFRPFLRESTRRAMDERYEEARRRGLGTVGELPERPAEELRRAEAAKPKAAAKKKAAKTTTTKEGDLF